MDTGKFIAPGKALLPLLCIMGLLLLICPMQARGEVPSMRSYCSVPPLPGTGVKPNLLLMIDNSASMYDPVYTDPYNYCLDDSVDTFEHGSQFEGYFDQGSLYSYNLTSGIFELAATGQTIASSACNKAKTDYVCVNISSGVLDNFLASGKFLNWLTMSKLDIEKKALTGGKVVAGGTLYPGGLLQSETRGCQGKRFVKMVGNSPITFAVRGPIPAESDYPYQASHGGMTRIEIYANRYKKTECLAAVAAWQSGSDPTDAVSSCMGPEFDENGTPTKGKVFARIMSLCYSKLAKGTSISVDDVATLQQDCTKRIKRIYDGDPDKVPKNNGDDVCGSGLYHNIRNGASYSTGFLGQCYSYSDETCTVTQTVDFCSEIANPWLADPSATAVMTGTNANLPGFILDAGIFNLGEPSVTMLARIAPESPPEGMIQKFSGVINLGAMVFNDNGSGSECVRAGVTVTAGSIPCVKHCQNDLLRECELSADCSSGSCTEDTGTDGGKIISYINHTGVGNHSSGSGLIASIDQVTANSWTPLAETFYEALGYFANQTGFRFLDADFNEAWPPSILSCQRNNILIVTDGLSTMDRKPVVNDFVATAVAAWRHSGMPGGLVVASSNLVAPTN